LNDYLRYRKRWDTLVQLNRTLVPGVPSPAIPAQLHFPRVAFESLQQAMRLQQLAESDPWIAPILDAFQTSADLAQPKRALADLQHALERRPFVQSILELLLRLRTYLQEMAVREPSQAAIAGQTVIPWATQLEKGLDGLQALINLEFDRRQRSGPAGEVLK